MAKISELKKMIIDLRVALISANIPRGHCPYAYYHNFDSDEVDCSKEVCDVCRSKFLTKFKEEIRKEVRKM